MILILVSLAELKAKTAFKRSLKVSKKEENEIRI